MMRDWRGWWVPGATSVWCLGWLIFEVVTHQPWYWAVLFAALLAFNLWFLPRSLRTHRRYQEAKARAVEAQLRFYWFMGGKGVPLDVVHRADQLMADFDTEDGAERAYSLLREYID